MRRRNFLGALPLLAGFGPACSPVHAVGRRRNTYVQVGAVGAERADRGTILVFMPETTQTKEVWGGLSDELGREFSLVAVKVEDRSGADVISEGMRRHRPSAIVLMNNPTVLAYRDFQSTSKVRDFPPAILVMTSFLDGQDWRVRGSTGISYEVPLITVVTNLRRLVATPIDRVGVVVRKPLWGFVERQARLAKREQIQVTAEVMSASPNASELKRALRRVKQKADVVWILNDDRLLTTRLIADGWLPGLDERPWSPAIVGAASLVSPLQSFGTFAVLPDHTALGIQTADLVFEIAERGWSLSDSGEQIELPLSTTTTIDLVQVRERFSLQTDALTQVDRIVE